LESNAIPEYSLTRKAYLRSGVQELRPHPLEEMGGKIRVVTLHPAEEVQCARTLTKLWLRGLKRCVVTKDMLTGKEVRLERQTGNSRMFSADLTAATDYIDHSLARHIGLKLCEVLHREEDVPLVEKIFSPKRLPSGDTTACGVHMGLGPSWVILSLLNGFSAWYAGARKETYRVCGDDLVGFWPRTVISKYTTTLERLGLVVNHSKSFVGRCGVFCERLVIPDGSIAVAQEIGHLSALTAAKYLANKTHNALAVADSLGGSILPIVSDATRRRLLPSRVGPGKVRHYGSGKGALEIGGLVRLAQGRTGLYRPQHLPKAVSKEIEKNLTNSGQIELSEFVIIFKTAQHLTTLTRGSEPDAPIPLSFKDFKKRSRLNRPSKHPPIELLEQAIRDSRISHRDKRIALWTIRTSRSLSTNTKARKRLENVLSRPAAKRFLKRELVAQIMSANFTLGVESRLIDSAMPRTGPQAGQGNRKVPEQRAL